MNFYTAKRQKRALRYPLGRGSKTLHRISLAARTAMAKAHRWRSGRMLGLRLLGVHTKRGRRALLSSTTAWRRAAVAARRANVL